MGFNLIGSSIFAMIFIIGVTEATNYTVGDSFGWSVPSSKSFYTDWASTKKFFVGDNLIFNWNGNHSIKITMKTIDYESCNSSWFDALTYLVTKNGTAMSIHTIDAPIGYRYFYCIVGNHCELGQKFSINVQSHSGSSPAPAPAPSFGILSAFLSSLAVYFFTLTR
ncbi:hypothetical protein JHK84_043831 [Glycine max]|uniref:Cucumber peeling cupredoxin n=1 Tax=Glycine soja TaxID=3848 RepID=A0A0B2R760_GLYSO|nr:cucumber peeling cupredoxin-like [Glycine soja]KAG5117718.1 hypothetical protein JHK84_043831 [Glycine max]KAH1148796.1 hypothetical protein GYH30_043430 [Glycine max]KHN27753.1 Cucumber peeling cupredoxin [Glycine soja]RZB66204.1 Cucumber peeling cupredoxin [Glycine soja]